MVWIWITVQIVVVDLERIHRRLSRIACGDSSQQAISLYVEVSQIAQCSP